MNLSVFIDFSLSVSPNAPPTPSACAELISQSPEVTSVAERVLAGPICLFFFVFFLAGLGPRPELIGLLDATLSYAFLSVYLSQKTRGSLVEIDHCIFQSRYCV